MMNSYLPWKGMHTITKVCGQVEDLVNAQIKYPRLHVIPLLLVLIAKTFHKFWTVVMALAPHDASPLPRTHPIQTLVLNHLNTYWTLSISPIISLSQQLLVPNETQPGLTSQNVRVMEDTLPPGKIPGADPCISWVFWKVVGMVRWGAPLWHSSGKSMPLNQSYIYCVHPFIPLGAGSWQYTFGCCGGGGVNGGAWVVPACEMLRPCGGDFKKAWGIPWFKKVV